MNEINAHEEPANVGAGLDREIQRTADPLQSPDPPNSTPAPPALNAEWLASLSHELRSPLTAIQGYASMLLRHNDHISPEEHQEFLLAITQSSNRMASVLDRIFDIANLEAGTIQFHPLPIDMSQLVPEVLLAEQHEYLDNSVAFTFKQESDPTLPLDQRQFIINADGSLIHKMLIQLLDNAQKYSASRTPIEVTLSSTSLNERRMQFPPHIRTQWLDHDQRLVELSIRDHGIGIPLADHERIFERFERVDMQLTREVSGLGLGLTMCKHIVMLHNGGIWVESTPGQGSTFHVLFPAAVSKQEQALPHRG